MSDQYNDNQTNVYDSGFIQDSSQLNYQQYENGNTPNNLLDSIDYSYQMESQYSFNNLLSQLHSEVASFTDELPSLEDTEIRNENTEIRNRGHQKWKLEDIETTKVPENAMDIDAEFHIFSVLTDNDVDLEINNEHRMENAPYQKNNSDQLLDKDSDSQNNSDNLTTNYTEHYLIDNDAKPQRIRNGVMDNDTSHLTSSENFIDNDECYKKKEINWMDENWYDICSETKSQIRRADELCKSDINEAICALKKILHQILSILKSNENPLNNANLVYRIENIIQQTSSQHNKEDILQYLYLSLRGHLLYEIEDFEEALECYEKFENLLSEDIFKMNVKRAKGDCLRKLKRYKDALKEYKQASKVENYYYSEKIDKALLYNSRGLLYMDNERLNKALSYFTKALKFNKNPLYYCNKAIVLSKLGQNTDVLKALEEASRLIPPDELTDNHTFYIKNVLDMIFKVWSCNEKFQNLINNFMNSSENGIDLVDGKHGNSIEAINIKLFFNEQNVEELKRKEERKGSTASDKSNEDLTIRIQNSPSFEQSIEESINYLRNSTAYEQNEKESNNGTKTLIETSYTRNEESERDKSNSLSYKKILNNPEKNIIKKFSKFMKCSKKFLSIVITTLNQDNDISIDAFQLSKSCELIMRTILEQVSSRFTNLDLINDQIMHTITEVMTHISNFNKQLEEQRTKLKEYVTNIDSNIKTRLNEYNKVLENNIDSSLSEEVKLKITDYYKAFIGTLLSACCSTQVLTMKWVEKRKHFLLFLISDFCTKDSRQDCSQDSIQNLSQDSSKESIQESGQDSNQYLGKIFKILEEPLKPILSGIISVFQKVDRHDGSNITGRLKFTYEYDELYRFLSEDILKFVRDNNKHKQIGAITMDDLKTIPDPLLKKIISCTEYSHKKVEQFLNSMMYHSVVERLGYIDAHVLLEKYITSNEHNNVLSVNQQSRDINVSNKNAETVKAYPHAFINNNIVYKNGNNKKISYQKYCCEYSEDATNLILALRLQNSKLQDATKKICERAIKGYWNETNTRFNQKSCFELFDAKYLQYKLKKRNQSQLQDDEIEQVQMALFNFMCTTIANNEMKNLDCVTNFSKDYYELVEQIAEEYPQYFVNEQIVKAAISSDQNLQEYVICRLNEINNNLYNNKPKDKYSEGLHQEVGKELLIEFELESKLCRRAIKGYWNESNTLFSKKSCKELFDKKYLTSKLKKITQSEILDEKIEELQMTMFKFMCTAIVNSKKKNMDCITGFAKDYPDLLKKIANQHPIYFFNEQVIKAAFSTDKNLQLKLTSELNEAINDQDKNAFLYE